MVAPGNPAARAKTAGYGMQRTSVLVSIAIAALGALCALGNGLGYGNGLDTLASRAKSSLTQADGRLSGQLEKYQYFPSVIALHPAMKELRSDPSAENVARANLILERLALSSGALDIYVMDADDATVAASHHNPDRSLISANFAWHPISRR